MLTPFCAEHYGRGVFNEIQRLYDEQGFLPLKPFQEGDHRDLPVMGIAFIAARDAAPLRADQLIYRTDQLNVVTVSRIPTAVLAPERRQRRRHWRLNLIEQSFARAAVDGQLMPKGRARQWRADARPLQDIQIFKQKRFITSRDSDSLPTRKLQSRFDGDFRVVTHLAHKEGDRPAYCDLVVRIDDEDVVLYRFIADDFSKIEVKPEGRIRRGACLAEIKEDVTYGEAAFHPDGAPKRIMTGGEILPVNRQPEMVTLVSHLMARMAGAASNIVPSDFLAWAPLRMAEYNVPAKEAVQYLVSEGILDEMENPLRMALLTMASNGQIADLAVPPHVSSKVNGKTFAIWYDFLEAAGEDIGLLMQAFLEERLVKHGEGGYNGNGFLVDARFLPKPLLTKACRTAWACFPDRSVFGLMTVPGRESRYLECECGWRGDKAKACPVCGKSVSRSPMRLPTFYGVINHAKWNEAPIGDKKWQFEVDGFVYDFTPRGEVGKDLGAFFTPPASERPPKPAAQPKPAEATEPVEAVAEVEEVEEVPVEVDCSDEPWS